MAPILRLAFYLAMYGLTLAAGPAMAWGKRGHALVAEAAAYALESKAPFLKSHSFDLGFYSNVPDIIWRRPETNDVERDEHYVNLEVFERAMGKENSDWIQNRKEFFKKYPDAKKGGLVFWRVSELCEELKSLQQKLLKNPARKEHQRLQMKWLSTAGAIGHYIADLAQPLHTTENYDGQMTGQKGIHSYYETELVNELYPQIANEVFERTQKSYAQISKKSGSCFEMARVLASVSIGEAPALLERDKSLGRKNSRQVADGHREAITTQLARGAAYLATIWSEYLGWKYDGKEFWNFDEKPDYLYPAE